MAVTGIEPKVVAQIGIVVADVERSVKHYADILGLPIPQIVVTESYDQSHATYRGQPTDARAKIACWNMGNVQVELLQPVGDQPSSWKDFLDQRGEGIQHIAFLTNNTDAAAASFAEYGYNIVQRGIFGGGRGSYTYLDTEKDFGIMIELLQFFGGNPQFQSSFPADQGIGTDVVCQVGIMVDDIQTTAQRYCEVLGLPQPSIFTTPGYDVVKTTFNGEPCDAKATLAFFDVGQIQLELIEPDEKLSVWRAFVERTGGGPHHIAFQIKDTPRVTEYLAKNGIPVIQQGLYGDLSGIYTYVDSEALLGTSVELLESYRR